MISRMLILMLALGSSLTSPLFAGTSRADHLIAESGGIGSVVVTPGVAVGLAFADFFALMPGDNSATVAPGTAVQFPQNGPTSGTIVRLNASQFLIPTAGTYRVLFQVSVSEPGQLQLSLNGIPIASSLVGRATGTDQIVGVSLLTTVLPNSILSVINPVGNSTALTITPVAGGTHSVSAHLVIIRIQ